MAYPSQVLRNFRDAVTLFDTAMKDAMHIARAGEGLYDNLGGSTFMEPYLEDEQGEPTTDVTVTDVANAVSSIRAIRQFIVDNFHDDVLAKMIRR